MDTLALLCNLHAEGPATLRKLRELGCKSIDDLTRLPYEAIAGLLEARGDAAQRFVHEGRLLHERFGSPSLERGAAPTSVHARPAPQTKPAPEAAPAPRLLAPGAIPGLDREWCQALVGQGILSLDQLADAPGLGLARALRRPFTQLLELQCFARRKSSEPAPPPREREVLLQPQRPALAAHRAPRAEAPLHERPVASFASLRPSPGSGGPFSGGSDIDAPGLSRESPYTER